MTEQSTVIREAMAMRERLAEMLEIVRAKADDPYDPDQAKAADMLLQMQQELAETDAGLRRVGLMQ